jgi:hypothetical protein
MTMSNKPRTRTRRTAPPIATRPALTPFSGLFSVLRWVCLALVFYWCLPYFFAIIHHLTEPFR